MPCWKKITEQMVYFYKNSMVIQYSIATYMKCVLRFSYEYRQECCGLVNISYIF